MEELTLEELAELISGITQFNPASYQYFNQLLNHRTVIFNQDVDENIIETVYIPLRDFEKDDSKKPVTLILNSTGGSSADGFFLAHYIATYKKKLNIIVPGYATSIATIILCGGGKNENVTRYCYPNSYALIHDGFITMQTQEEKSAADIMTFNDRVDKDIRQFVIDNTNITAEQYDAQTRKQWFITAEEMKQFNMIDKIITKEDDPV